MSTWNIYGGGARWPGDDPESEEKFYRKPKRVESISQVRFEEDELTKLRLAIELIMAHQRFRGKR
jgi:hypothetical protein